MTVFNMIAIVPLSSQAINALKDYETNYKKKKSIKNTMKKLKKRKVALVKTI